LYSKSSSLQQWFVRCVVDVVATAAAANENQTHMLSVGRSVGLSTLELGARSPGRAAAAATEQQ